MKTKKVKGFTLIELIVVIAIIGVLAAILVPAMLGYVKKSKIQGANSAASTILKACNSALAELDEIDEFYADALFDRSADDDDAGVGDDELISYMEPYFDNAANAKFQVVIRNNTALVCVAKSGTYFGSSPTAYTNKNYPDDCDFDMILNAAVEKYNAKHEGHEITLS